MWILYKLEKLHWTMQFMFIISSVSLSSHGVSFLKYKLLNQHLQNYMGTICETCEGMLLTNLQKHKAVSWKMYASSWNTVSILNRRQNEANVSPDQLSRNSYIMTQEKQFCSNKSYKLKWTNYIKCIPTCIMLHFDYLEWQQAHKIVIYMLLCSPRLPKEMKLRINITNSKTHTHTNYGWYCYIKYNHKNIIHALLVSRSQTINIPWIQYHHHKYIMYNFSYKSTSNTHLQTQNWHPQNRNSFM